MLPDHWRTFQWARELRRSGARNYSAVFFVLDDSEPVLVGHYQGEKTEMTAAAAHAFFQSTETPFSYEVIAPRSIRAAEIKKIAPAPQITGWRFHPAAKGRRPFWPISGTSNAAKLRRSIEAWQKSYDS